MRGGEGAPGVAQIDVIERRPRDGDGRHAQTGGIKPGHDNGKHGCAVSDAGADLTTIDRDLADFITQIVQCDAHVDLWFGLEPDLDGVAVQAPA